MPDIEQNNKTEQGGRPQGESFSDYLRRHADEYEREAPKFADCQYYPTSWWLASAAGARRLAEQLDGRRS